MDNARAAIKIIVIREPDGLGDRDARAAQHGKKRFGDSDPGQSADMVAHEVGQRHTAAVLAQGVIGESALYAKPGVQFSGMQHQARDLR